MSSEENRSVSYRAARRLLTDAYEAGREGKGYTKQVSQLMRASLEHSGGQSVANTATLKLKVDTTAVRAWLNDTLSKFQLAAARIDYPPHMNPDGREYFAMGVHAVVEAFSETMLYGEGNRPAERMYEAKLTTVQAQVQTMENDNAAS